MSVFGRLGAAISGLARKSADVLSELPQMMRYPEAKSGQHVSVRTAIEVSTVFACARLIAEGIAQVPVRFYGTDAKGRSIRLRKHPLLPLLTRRPNGWQTSFEFFETLLLHLILCGNAFVFVNRVGGRPVELIIIEPGNVTVTRAAWPSLELSYQISFPEGINGQTLSKRLGSDVIWHIRGPSWNTWMGLEVIKVAREAIGLAMATEEAHARLHKNGAQVSGVYAVPDKLPTADYEKLRDWIVENHTGANASKPLILDRGATWVQQQLSGMDAQHLETRRFQVEEICRSLRVIPMMVGHSDKTATYASAEQMFIAHVVHTLSPWAKRLETSIETGLVADNDNTEVKFHLNGLMRGAAADRAAYFAKALGAGGSPAWMTQNEVREEDDLDPLDDPKYDELPQATNVAPGQVDPKTTDPAKVAA